MADKDTRPVTVELDRPRPYRENESDRTAVWVGPGRVSVPAWVAQAWGMDAVAASNPVAEPDPEPEPEPFILEDLDLSEYQIQLLAEAGYDDVHKIAGASDEELLAINGIGPATVTHIRQRIRNI